METEREWKFIKNQIQNRSGSKYDEWFIGFDRNLTTGNWTWINGKPLTIDKWQKNNPDNSESYALIHKEFPARLKGSFSSIKGNILRGWICEGETGTDRSVPYQYRQANSIKPLPGIKLHFQLSYSHSRLASLTQST